MLIKRKNKYIQLSYKGKNGNRYPEREIVPKEQYPGSGIFKYRYQGMWLTEKQMEELCNQN
jgi:hypothetical protein